MRGADRHHPSQCLGTGRRHGDAGTRFIWIADLLPDDLAGPIGKLMHQGARVIKQTLETGPHPHGLPGPTPGRHQAMFNSR
jgi:hypothetical protein